MNRRTFFFSCIIWVFLSFCSFGPAVAQTLEREYVIAVGDELSIQVWNLVQPLPNFSSRVSVRSDRMVTMAWLGDIKIAGLKKSTLTERLESKEFLGKYLTEPRVTITPVGTAQSIRIFFSGVFPMEQEFPRDVRFGQVLQEIAPLLQQYAPDFGGITLQSAEGEELPANQNLRLQWGDEIFIPALEPTPTPIPTEIPQPIPSVLTQVRFSPQEYQEFQDFLSDYPEDREILQPFIRIEEDYMVLDFAQLSEEQQASLSEAVMAALEQYNLTEDIIPEVPSLSNATLLGITVNLTADGLREAFLAVPDPNLEGEVLIKVFQEGDVVEREEVDAEDLILTKIDAEENLVILKTQEETQTLTLSPQFVEITLSGMLMIGGKQEVVLSDIESQATASPGQRKRFKAGDLIKEDILLAAISAEQKMVVLQKGEELQLLFLRDPTKRVVEPPPASPEELPEGEIPEAAPVPEEGPAGQLPLPGLLPEGMQERLQSSMPLSEGMQQGMQERLQSSMPLSEGMQQGLSDTLQQELQEQLQALDTFSELFFATSILDENL